MILQSKAFDCTSGYLFRASCLWCSKLKRFSEKNQFFGIRTVSDEFFEFQFSRTWDALGRMVLSCNYSWSVFVQTVLVQVATLFGSRYWIFLFVPREFDSLMSFKNVLRILTINYCSSFYHLRNWVVLWIDDISHVCVHCFTCVALQCIPCWLRIFAFIYHPMNF